MEQLQPILLTLIVFALNILGKFLKESKFFPDEMIPNILGVLGGLIGTILFKDPTAIALGFSAVGVHQSYRQTVGKNDTNKTEDK